MADVDLRANTVRARSLEGSDLIFGASPAEANAAEAFGADTYAEVKAAVLAELTGAAVRDLLDAVLGTGWRGGGGIGAITARFGSSDDNAADAAELTVAAVAGVGTVPAYAGSRYLLLARLDSEDDIVSVLFSDDQSMTNQIGAFTKAGATVGVGGDAYAVWVSNQALTQAAALTITVR